MTILCFEHKYLWTRLELEQIYRYINWTGCTACQLDKED